MVVIPDAPRVPRGTSSPGFLSAGNGVVAPQNATGKQLAGLGEAATELGVGLTRQAYLEAQKINGARTREVAAKASSVDLQSWFGLQDLKGQAGVDAAPKALEDFDLRTAEFAKTLDNDDQRFAFTQRRLAEREEFEYRIGSYRAKQIDVMDKAASDASLASAKNRAIAFGDTADPDVAPGQDPQVGPPRAGPQERIAVVIMEAQQRMAKDGFPPDSEASNLFVLSQTTEVHKGLVQQRLADGRVEDASAYLASNRGGIEPEVATALQGDIARAAKSRSAAAQKSQDDDDAARLVDSMAGLSEPEALDQLRALHQDNKITIDVRQAAEARVRTREADSRRQHDDAKDAVLGSISATWMQEFDAQRFDYRTSWQSAYAKLPADVREDIESRGLEHDAAKRWGDVKRERFIDATSKNPEIEITAANFESVNRVNEAIKGYNDRLSNVTLGDRGKTPEAKAEAEVIKRRIAEAEQILEAMQARVFDHALHIEPNIPSTSWQAATQGPPPAPVDPVKRAADQKARAAEQRRKLYGKDGSVK